MPIQQQRDLEFTIKDSEGNDIPILIGLYEGIGLSRWSIILSVEQVGKSWKQLVYFGLFDGPLPSSEDIAFKKIGYFCKAARTILDRVYGAFSVIINVDEDPDTESPEEMYVRIMLTYMAIDDNRPTMVDLESE